MREYAAFALCSPVWCVRTGNLRTKLPRSRLASLVRGFKPLPEIPHKDSEYCLGKGLPSDKRINTVKKGASSPRPPRSYPEATSTVKRSLHNFLLRTRNTILCRCRSPRRNNRFYMPDNLIRGFVIYAKIRGY